jgi:predicted transcriptional regulator
MVQNESISTSSQSSSPGNVHNGKKGIFDYTSSSKQVLKLLDATNVKIISELVNNPTMSSLALSKKLDVPLSTIQRRRAQLEKSILKRTILLIIDPLEVD